jgi:hypothetical protein
MVACHVAISYDARGPNNTITLGEQDHAPDAQGEIVEAQGE